MERSANCYEPLTPRGYEAFDNCKSFDTLCRSFVKTAALIVGTNVSSFASLHGRWMLVGERFELEFVMYSNMVWNIVGTTTSLNRYKYFIYGIRTFIIMK